MDDDQKKLRDELNNLQTKRVIRELHEEDLRQDQSTRQLKHLKKSIDDFLKEKNIFDTCEDAATKHRGSSRKVDQELFDGYSGTIAKHVGSEKKVDQVKQRFSKLLENVRKDECPNLETKTFHNEKTSRRIGHRNTEQHQQHVRKGSGQLICDQDIGNEKEYPIGTSTAETTYEPDESGDDADVEEVYLSSERSEGGRSHIYQKIRHIRTMLMRREEELMTGQLVIDDEVCVFQETSRVNY